MFNPVLYGFCLQEDGFTANPAERQEARQRRLPPRGNCLRVLPGAEKNKDRKGRGGPLGNEVRQAFLSVSKTAVQKIPFRQTPENVL